MTDTDQKAPAQTSSEQSTGSGPKKIVLYTFGPIWGAPSLSPPCGKFETWLRMAGLQYEVNLHADLANQAPKGKAPYIEYEGQLMSDSTLMIDFFRDKYGVDVDSGLSTRDRAISLAFRRMVKENMYWHVFRIRYHESNLELYQQSLRTALFPPDTPDEVVNPVLEVSRRSSTPRCTPTGSVATTSGSTPRSPARTYRPSRTCSRISRTTWAMRRRFSTPRPIRTCRASPSRRFLILSRTTRPGWTI